MEMREKIKLKSKNKNILQKKEPLPKINEFIYENDIIKETEENESEKYEKILVNKKIYFIIKNIYFIAKKRIREINQFISVKRVIRRQ
jgi:hypothetical protein